MQLPVGGPIQTHPCAPLRVRLSSERQGYRGGMAEIVRTVRVSIPIETVWSYVSDFTTTEEWDPPTVSTVRTSGDGGVGTTYHNVSRLLGTEQEVDYRVTECEDQVLLQLEGDAGSVKLRDTITFVPTPEGGTEVTYRAEFHPVGVARVAGPLLPAPLKILGDRVAKSLEEKLERL
jgi:uncharacterized protein YndB with AHSA1/START domain